MSEVIKRSETITRVSIAIGEKIKPALEGGKPVRLGDVAIAAITAMSGFDTEKFTLTEAAGIRRLFSEALDG
jgi:hypothetical protein